MRVELVIFFACVIEFHISEYLLAKKYQSECTASSFLITWPYVAAMSVGLVEYMMRSAQGCLPWQILGMIMIVSGEFLRKTAIFTAKENFSHKIAMEHSHNHVLCTQGIYSHVRHPSYLGFCVFAVGTQIWIGNYICPVVFTLILWNFMSRRIAIEDTLLLQFFGKEWLSYSKATWSGIPFVP